MPSFALGETIPPDTAHVSGTITHPPPWTLNLGPEDSRRKSNRRADRNTTN